jgi:hypothetical protein
LFNSILNLNSPLNLPDESNKIVKLPHINPTLFIILGTLAVNTHAVSAKKMYRWVDEYNNVTFSDKKPPDQTNLRIESLNKNAQVIAIIEKEKTREQKALDRRFLKLRKQQQTAIDKQKKQDNTLMSNYHSTHELQLALDDKMSSLDIQINVVQRNVDRLNDQLKQQQKFAAQFERDGRGIPKNSANAILSTKAQIQSTQLDIAQRLQKKTEIRQHFEKDMVRLTFLAQSKIRSQKYVFNTTLDAKNEDQLGIYTCTSIKSCNKAWQAARQFINTHSTTDLYVEKSELIMSQDPSTKPDLSLSISKKNINSSTQQLFLDIRCHNSSIGKERCSSSKAKNLRYSFNGFIKSALTTH